LGFSQGKNIEQINTIPKDMRSNLMQYEFGGAEIHDKLISKDGTRKYLFLFGDGNIVEGVLMQYQYGNTACISTQVGCAMGCAFCASTLEGKVRDLSPGEMLSQVLLINKDAIESGAGKLTNIVLMGSGEPLDNLDNVLKFLELVNCKEGLNIGMRNISLSTCGLVDKIYALAKLKLGVTLSISLHAPNDDIRRQTMPIAKRYSIDELIDAARYYISCTGRRVIFEYTLIQGVNDGIEHAQELARRLRKMQCHVNLIPLNSVEERNLRSSITSSINAFSTELKSLNISCSVRREMGSDISGACGQLRRKHLLTGERK
jgi:23S rRNA (adenine2503-C2)-methyltransferase